MCSSLLYFDIILNITESKMKCNYDNLLLSNMKHKSIEEGLMDKSRYLLLIIILYFLHQENYLSNMKVEY
jgi:hypothetical protein